MTTATITPMMAQWHSCKEEAKDALLLFRLGDFYEAFHQDAKIISKELSLTLTARQEIPMCGIPFHTSENYIDKLIAKGFKVAIAEQMEDSQNGKGLLKREIVRIVTPGTIVSSQLLKDKKNNFFASVTRIGSIYGLSFIDISTGDFRALELETEQELLNEIYRLKPAEFLIDQRFQDTHPQFFNELSHTFAFLLNVQNNVELPIALQTLTLHFEVHNLDGFGLRGQTAAIVSAGALLLYFKENLNLDLEHITSIHTESLSQYMCIDRSTIRHLELIESLSDSKSRNSLFHFMDDTATPMGGRLLYRWIQHPLLNPTEILKRQEAVTELMAHPSLLKQSQSLLEKMRDIERLIIKIKAKMATPRDLLALGQSLNYLPPLKKNLSSLQTSEMQTLCSDLFDAEPISQKIIRFLQENPPIRFTDGGIFNDGIFQQLDELRKLSKESMHWVTNYQNHLREKTSIKTLKVGFTRAFGYYIEISKAQSEKSNQIPSDFQRRQTLTNGERYVTDELKQFEHQVLTAEERSKAFEAEQFELLRQEIAQLSPFIHKASQAIAKIDLFCSFAKIAKQNDFCAPTLDLTDRLEIQNGRHPIVEKNIGRSSFIANDTHLSSQNQMMILTGPNMAGKSTYIRQVALIVIMAQMGSYVPASSAHIGIIDKVFSRIGASDDLARGQSTFMVEMSETAHILNQATSKSLVLLDEIGRGTSTYDGISIAWSVAEFLLTTARRQAKTLFATHYWELTQLEKEHPQAKNFHTAIQENGSHILFLRKIVPGGTDKSYGIHVARLAGLPSKAIRRAEEMLLQLESKSKGKKTKADSQLTFFNPPPLPDLIHELKDLDVNRLSPLQALQKLSVWKNQYGN